MLNLCMAERAILLIQKAHKTFAELQEDIYRSPMDFSQKPKNFCKRFTMFLGVKCPLYGCLLGPIMVDSK